MCDRPPERLLGLLGLLAVGCVPDPGAPLDPVVDALAQETADVAGPAVTATLLTGALAADLCVRADEAVWDEVAEGDPAPLPEPLASALGAPEVASVSVAGSGDVLAKLSGVTILDRASSSMSLDASFNGDLTVRLGLSDDDGVYGEVVWEVRQTCAEEASWLQGSATWTDLDGRGHTLAFPDDSETSYTARYTAAGGWLPAGGRLGWSGALRDVTVQVLTADAAGLTDLATDAAGLPTARWPASATSESWSADLVIPIAP